MHGFTADMVFSAVMLFKLSLVSSSTIMGGFIRYGALGQKFVVGPLLTPHSTEHTADYSWQLCYLPRTQKPTRSHTLE